MCVADTVLLPDDEEALFALRPVLPLPPFGTLPGQFPLPVGCLQLIHNVSILNGSRHVAFRVPAAVPEGQLRAVIASSMPTSGDMAIFSL